MISLFNKNAPEKTRFTLTGDSFSYKGRTYRLSDIAQTRSYRVVYQIRHVALGVTTNNDSAFSFVLVMRDGETIQVTEKSTLLSSTKQERVDQLHKSYDFICEHTFQQRAQKYLSQIETEGYFDYGMWRFSASQQKIIDTESGKGYLLGLWQQHLLYDFSDIQDTACKPEKW